MRKKFRILRTALRALHAYRRGKTTLQFMPSYIWIEPTNHCNLSCIMCPTGAGKVQVEKGYMDLVLYKSILSQIQDHASTVILAMSGESLLHPDLPEMIALGRRMDIKMALNTNATLLTEQAIEDLLDSDLSYISFAFDGFNEKTYEQVRQGADYSRTLSNIFKFLEAKKRRGLRSPYAVLSLLRFSLDDSTPVERRAFLSRFDGLIDDIHLREVNSWGRMFMDTKSFQFARYETPAGPCGRLWNSLALTWNGDVVPCTYNMNHDYVIGNIASESLADIWNAPRQTALRQAFVEGNPLSLSPLCENCTVAGSPKILGIPAGLRASLADAVDNFFGYGFEKTALSLAGRLRRGEPSAERMSKKFRNVRKNGHDQ